MHYLALACDYDGTIASQGRVDQETIRALGRVPASGRRLLLVTGRHIDDLLSVFPEITVFNMVVAENGGLLYEPGTGRESTLAESPPRGFVTELRRRGVEPLIPGRVVVATAEPYDNTARQLIDEMGLKLDVILNKGSVMIVPRGVNKGTGLRAAASKLKIPPDRMVSIGDAENDDVLLSSCGFGAAVANALPSIKEQADLVTVNSHGRGVAELIDQLVTGDLQGLKQPLQQQAPRP